MHQRLQPIVLLLLSLAAGVSLADAPAFDLTGPTLDVSVTRGLTTLPVTRVPALAAGDHLTIRARLPSSQSARYLMVAAFLRGPTNPPPTEWFHRCDTWARACQDEGLSLVVPGDAQQLLIFFAPETGGDFKTLMNAVRGKPGAFVRASQELNQAALDRLRLERYVAELHTLEQTDMQKVKDAAPLLARSLAIKVNEKCLGRAVELQVPCLMEGRDALILEDGHGTSMVATLTSGPASDLALQAGSTPMFGGGFSPYIGPVLDIARLLDSFHTAKYQYIPALMAQRGDRLALMLNTPPSFHDPQSVLVAALPAVAAASPPALHPVDPKQAYCVRQAPLLLPVDGAPLVFATTYARDLVLHVPMSGGSDVDLPARADPAQGGYVVDTAQPGAATMPDHAHATLRGWWGFDRYEGPGFELANPPEKPWTLVDGEEAALIVGREDTVHLESGTAACLESVHLRDAAGLESPAPFKLVHDGRIELKVPLADARPGRYTLVVREHGGAAPQLIAISAYVDPGRLDGYTLHAGDATGVLRGSRLDQVAGLTLRGAEFTPGELTSSKGTDELVLTAADLGGATFRAGETLKARVQLKDGRSYPLDVAVAPARPRAVLIAKSIVPLAASAGAPFGLGAQDELPLDARLTFSLRAQTPAAFARDEEIEVATEDESYSVRLGTRSGGLTLENSRVAVATLDPSVAFGASAYGALRYRRIIAGVAGDWHALVTLVRLPQLTGLKCAADDAPSCELSGTNLFLIDSVAAEAAFSAPVSVPDGFPGMSLRVPRPTDGKLYVKLRDDPSAVNVVSIASTP